MEEIETQSGIDVLLLHTLKNHKGPVTNGRFTDNGNYFMSCGQDKALWLWNPLKGIPIKEYKGPHNREVNDVAIFLGNGRFVSVGAESVAFLWDVTTARVIRKFSGHEGKLHCCRLSPNNEVLLTGSYDKTVRLWDMKSHSHIPLQVLRDAKDSVTGIAVSEHEIITASLDGHLRTYDIRVGTLCSDQLHHPIISLSLSQQHNCACLNCFDSTCRLVDRRTGEEVHSFTGHKVSSSRIGCQFDTSDSHVVSGSESGEVMFWKISQETGKPCFTIQPDKAHLGGALSCHYAPVTLGHPEAPAPMLVTTGADSTIKVWSTSQRGQI